MRLLVIGSHHWSDHRQTMAALRRVMTVYREPYTLICDTTNGAARHATVGARELGWEVEEHRLDVTKCGPDCPPSNHRRHSGPDLDYCPTAGRRNLRAMLADADHAIVFTRPRGRSTDNRIGQQDIRRHDIGIWTYTQKDGGRRGNQTH